MSFHDVRFPLDIAFGSAGGPGFRVDVVTLAGGHEERNALWAHPRHRYDVGLGLRSDNDLHQLIAFFKARRGRLHAFRFRDWQDWKSCPPLQAPSAVDQAIGLGDGSTAEFALAKVYVSGAHDYRRLIRRPVEGSVAIAVDGMPVAAIDHIVDHGTGLVTFSDPPVPGAAITAGFEFDVPVRFDIEQLSISLADFRAGQIPSIPLIEVLS